MANWRAMVSAANKNNMLIPENASFFEPFDLDDQYGNKFSMESFKGNVFVIFGADRTSYLYINPWRNSLWECFKDIKIIGLANASPLNELFKWVLPEIIYEKPFGKTFQMFMDWKGYYFKKLGMEIGFANMLVVSRDQKIVFSDKMKKYNQDKMKEITSSLRNILE